MDYKEINLSICPIITIFLYVVIQRNLMSVSKLHEKIQELENEIKDILEGTTIFSNVRFYNGDELIFRYKINEKENEAVILGFRERIEDKLRESCHEIAEIKRETNNEEDKFVGVYNERVILNPSIRKKEKEKVYHEILSDMKKNIENCMKEHKKTLSAYLRVKNAKK